MRGVSKIQTTGAATDNDRNNQAIHRQTWLIRPKGIAAKQHLPDNSRENFRLADSIPIILQPDDSPYISSGMPSNNSTRREVQHIGSYVNGRHRVKSSQNQGLKALAGNAGAVAKFSGKVPVRLFKKSTISATSPAASVLPSCTCAMMRTASDSVPTEPS